MRRTQLIPGLFLLLTMLPGSSQVSASDTALDNLGPSTPALIEMAVERGDIDRLTGDRYLVAAIRGEEVPETYESATPFRGTLHLLELRQRLKELSPGADRRALRGLLHPVADAGMDQCDVSSVPLPNTIESAHFYIEYSSVALGGGLTIDDYIAALEESWTKEVDQFGWAAPPPYTPNPAPGNKYPVRIDPLLAPNLYGFVSSNGTHAGRVGNNPATSWNEGDAYASCMVLNSNYDPFPGTPLGALQSTASHEFNHSIQYGWGVLAGLIPDYIFFEGGATWMEDEVFDSSNDNYNYLWPAFEDDMGEYKDNLPLEPYEYWVTWRGLTEPYGTGIPGGGEDVFQRLWEAMSKNKGEGLEALDASLEEEGTSLGVAFHAYAIAVKFAKACGGGYQSPHCLEEGPAYVAAKGPNIVHGTVTMNGTRPGSLADNYAINWIALPENTDLQAVLGNTSGSGRFRASLACDTGAGLVISPFTDVVDGGETAYVRSWVAGACPAPIAVITTVSRTAANPPQSVARQYTLSVTPPADSTKLSVGGRVSVKHVRARGRLTPPGGRVEVILFERDGGWEKVKTRKVNVKNGGKFRTDFPAPDAKRCRLEARFGGNTRYLPSSAAKTFSC